MVLVLLLPLLLLIEESITYAVTRAHPRGPCVTGSVSAIAACNKGTGIQNGGYLTE